MNEVGPEGKEGCTLEAVMPLDWVGTASVDETYILALIRRMRACAYREPDLVSLFGMSRAALMRLLSDTRAVFSREETLEMIDVPNVAADETGAKLTIYGDLHGDLFSFLKALAIVGLPSDDNRIVIAGDLVDRGCWGVELLIIVMALKCWRPGAVVVIRGNHETSGCTSRYGFESECKRKYDLKTYKLFLLTLRELPLAVIVQSLPPARGETGDGDDLPTGKNAKANRRQQARPRRAAAKSDGAKEPWAQPPPPGGRRTLVVHGGLWRANHGGSSSLAIGSLRDLAETKRQEYDPEDSCAEDCLWSDPGRPAEPGVKHNSLRGAGIFYGSGAVDAFLKREYLGMIVRAHEGPDARKQRPEMDDMMKGYSCDLETPSGPLITMFSSANYCSHGNEGAVAVFTRANYLGLPKFISYDFDGPSDPELFYNPDPSQNRPTTPRGVPSNNVF